MGKTRTRTFNRFETRCNGSIRAAVMSCLSEIRGVHGNGTSCLRNVITSQLLISSSGKATEGRVVHMISKLSTTSSALSSIRSFSCL